MMTEIADILLRLQGQVGVGSLNSIVSQCGELGIKKPLIVTDPVIVKIGLAQRVVDLFSTYGQQAVIFDQCVENPLVPDITIGAEKFNAEGCDGIIGLGGGSPIDQAKVIRIVAKYGGTALDYNAWKGGVQKIKAGVVPMVVVPTTAGTGSEASRVSMVTDPESKTKFPVGSRFIQPDRVILDPELTVTMPPLITAATGMDALVHALESYVNLNTDLFAYSFNRTGFELVGRSLKQAVENGKDLEARGDMMTAATMGGMSMVITGLGAVHALAHPLSALAGVPHGTANSIMLPHVMKFNSEVAGKQYVEAAQLMGFWVNTADEAIVAITNFAAEIGLPTTLTAAGVSKEMLEQLSIDAFNDSTHKKNPIPTTQEDLRQMYLSAM